MKKIDLKHHLQTIIDNQPHSIKAYVAQEAIDYEDIPAFFSDLLQHGCVSGMVGSLVFYTGTHQFFDDHYDEIEVLIHEFEEETGHILKIGYDLKNTFAWFAFEQVAFELSSELEVL